MRLAGATTSDTRAADMRGRLDKAADRRRDDRRSSSFDGALAETDARDATRGQSQAAQVNATAASPKAVSAPSAPDAGSIFQALAGRSEKDSGAAADPTQDATAAKAGAASAAAGSLAAILEQVGKKDAAEDPTQSADPAPSQTAPAVPDVMAMLMGGAATTAAPAALSAAVSGADPQSKSGPGDKVNEDGAAKDEAGKAGTVTDISVSTYFAPVAPVQDRAASRGHGGAPADAQDESQLPTPGSRDGSMSQSTAGSGGATPADASLADATKLAVGDTAAIHHHGEPTTGLVPGALQAAPGVPPIQSIAGAIAGLAGPTAASADPTPTVSPAPVAKTLTLQMSPADLGTVDIRLHMSGRSLDVALTISDSRTLGIVNRERDALASALHDQSYDLQSLTIQDVGAAASSGGNHGSSGGPSTNGGDPRSGSGDLGSRGGGAQGQGSGRSVPSEQRPPGRDAMASPSAARDSGSLFV